MRTGDLKRELADTNAEWDVADELKDDQEIPHLPAGGYSPGLPKPDPSQKLDYRKLVEEGPLPPRFTEATEKGNLPETFELEALRSVTDRPPIPTELPAGGG